MRGRTKTVNHFPDAGAPAVGAFLFFFPFFLFKGLFVSFVPFFLSCPHFSDDLKSFV